MSGDTTLLAMICLNEATLPPWASVCATYRERMGTGSLPDTVDEQDGTLIVPMGDNSAVITLMPAPIPWTDLEGPCATAWWWPDATERMEPHKAHVVVALSGDAGAVALRHVQLTHLVAAVAAHADAIGVYWGAGTLVHAADTFVEQTRILTPDDLQPSFWIDMRLVDNEDGTLRYFTTGMAAFGKLELEIERTRSSPEEILEFCYGIIHYILTNDVTIGHGETIGRSADEKVVVTHAASMWQREGPVMKLAFE